MLREKILVLQLEIEMLQVSNYGLHSVHLKAASGTQVYFLVQYILLLACLTPTPGAGRGTSANYALRSDKNCVKIMPDSSKHSSHRARGTQGQQPCTKHRGMQEPPLQATHLLEKQAGQDRSDWNWSVACLQVAQTGTEEHQQPGGNCTGGKFKTKLTHPA